LKNREFDIAVIGGGLVGSAIAWGLASGGQRAAVLDEGDMAPRASRGNFALVWVQGKGAGLPQYGWWTLRAAESWTAFADMLLVQTGIDVAYRRPGGFHLALSESELGHRAELLQRIHAQPGMPDIGLEILDATQVRRYLPEAGPEVAGGSFTRLDGHCDSLKLLHALHVGMQQLGVQYLPDHRVESLAKSGGEFRIATRGGELRAAKVVIAAGLDGARLGPMVGLDVRVRPQRGHLLVTERTGPFLHYPVSTVRQTDEGTVMLGDSQEEGPSDTRVSHAVIATLADRAARMFPRLGALNIVRSWAALRVMPEDRFPIYDQSSACPGAFVAACHSGVTLAANHALILAPHIAKGALPDDLFQPFSARRFDVQKAA
jgi:glycine/D-amino acid oxidase-like deaminating enzyme